MWGGKSLQREFCLSQVSVSALIECGFYNLWREGFWSLNAYHASFAAVAIFSMLSSFIIFLFWGSK